MPTSNLYKLGVLSNMKEVHNKINVEEFEIQWHFYAGKPLRRGTLQANSGSYAQPFSVSSVALDS
jgi:predicted HAD superfamily phosphohydrolase YqeG